MMCVGEGETLLTLALFNLSLLLYKQFSVTILFRYLHNFAICS
jgi:hypothetical protein